MRAVQLLLDLLPLAITTRAACACGYSVNDTSDNSHAIFTDLFETDFLHTNDLTFNSSYSTGWQPQNYSQPNSGKLYGMAKESRNLVANPIPDRYDWFGQGLHGGAPGLQLWVRDNLVESGDEELVPSAEIVSERNDILYGSFRIGMKITSVSGTCAAFFFYRNDSQEIDLEILSADLQPSVHLVVQNPSKSLPTGNEPSSQRVVHLPTSSAGMDVDYNEYRFDWLPDRIDYYINSDMVWSMSDSIPSAPGRIHISHWSDGNPLWSKGPPEEDAVITVSYVKAYFNSSEPSRTSRPDNACGSGESLDQKEICRIPNQDSPPNPFGPHANETGHTFFFTQQHNMTINQTVYESDANSLSLMGGAMLAEWLVVLYALISLGPICFV